MKVQIAIYLTVTLIVFGLGYIVFSFLFSDANKSPPPLSVSTENATDPMPSETQSLLVKTVIGVVERSGIAENDWTPVQPGNELFADEKIRTDRNATVRLQADDASKIELAGESEISIQEINSTVHQIKLELGELNVDYRKSRNRRLKIVSDPETGDAETRGGRFIIQKRDGKLSVATEAGDVSLNANDKTVAVGPGKLSYVLPGEAPSPPKPIPLSIMLRVANPKRLKQTERTTTIKGQTDIVAKVRINDISAPVGQDGRFEVTIPLKNGRNPIEIVATTAYGQTEKKLPTVLVVEPRLKEEPPPVESAEVKWGRKKKPKRVNTPNANKNHQ